MRSRFTVSLLCGIALWMTPANAKGKPLKVSKDNFVSLQWSRSGGIVGISEQYTIQNREIIQPGKVRGSGFGSGSSGGYSGPPRVEDIVIVDPPQAVPVSDNQWKELIEQLKKANVPAIAGNYKQPNLNDGFNETLVLKLSDNANLDQAFTLSNYGDRAPASYYKLSAYLSALVRRKFPAYEPVSALPDAPSLPIPAPAKP